VSDADAAARPVLLAVADPALGTPWPRPRSGADDERLAEDWNAAAWLLVWSEGHGSCGGWQYAPETRRLTCACGQLAFEIGMLKGAAA